MGSKPTGERRTAPRSPALRPPVRPFASAPVPRGEVAPRNRATGRSDDWDDVFEAPVPPSSASADPRRASEPQSTVRPGDRGMSESGGVVSPSAPGRSGDGGGGTA